jgi:hypothetical protein
MSGFVDFDVASLKMQDTLSGYDADDEDDVSPLQSEADTESSVPLEAETDVCTSPLSFGPVGSFLLLFYFCVGFQHILEVSDSKKSYFPCHLLCSPPL